MTAKSSACPDNDGGDPGGQRLNLGKIKPKQFTSVIFEFLQMSTMELSYKMSRLFLADMSKYKNKYIC